MYALLKHETVVHIFLFHFLRLMPMESFFFNVLSALLLRRAELLPPKNSEEVFNCDVGCIYENAGPRSVGDLFFSSF